MIIMDIKVDNIYAFKDFHINMSYPKKIVNSTIENEFLEERTNFRYKKVNIIMGTNATGKTTMGKLLMLFTNYLNDGGYKRFTNRIADVKKAAKLQIDFVTNENLLYRFEMNVGPKTQKSYTEEDVDIKIYYTPIETRDSYETCASRLDMYECEETTYEKVNTNGWKFSYPIDSSGDKVYSTIEENSKYIYILQQILKTLDSSVEEVVKVSEVENTYVIKWKNCSAIIKDGKIANGEVMSSGTKAGLEISYIITSLLCDMHDLYYCDELFSYVNSDIEKACLSIIIEKLSGRKQLFFTTHNSDILDMQLPKHSFTFLKKDVNNEDDSIKCIAASQYLKRSTDSLKHAVENDLFCTAPELHRLFEIADLLLGGMQMRKSGIYQYYVEGEDERSLLNTLKLDLRCIESGKIDKFNVIQSRFTTARMRTLKTGTTVVLVYDTDVEMNTKILDENIAFLKRQKGIKEVICIPQVRNLEDELVRACNIKNIVDLTKSLTKADYKRDLINCSNLSDRLKKCKFDITKIWAEIPKNNFKKYGNDSEKIKIKSKK